MITKQDMIEAIDIEIEDRADIPEEVNGLEELKQKVNSEKPLMYIEYEWLCYLVANMRESQLRDELEN